MRIQHLALKTNDLEGTYTFYTDILGCDDAKRDPEGGRIWLNFADGFTLIFDRSDETLHPSTVQYLGLELEDFGAVDRMYQKIAPHVAIGRDMRDLYREAQGPYGFFVKDPNGYQIKVFKYNA
jgi:catechol 2,3-dioxygenase-like lactoylglutathione lyase family enzyme